MMEYQRVTPETEVEGNCSPEYAPVPDEAGNFSPENEGKDTTRSEAAKSKEVKYLLKMLDKAVRGQALAQKEEEAAKAGIKKRKNQSGGGDCKDIALTAEQEDEIEKNKEPDGLEYLMMASIEDECDPELLLCGSSELSVAMCLMEIIDQHRNPFVQEDIDYGDAWLQEEIQFLKRHAGGTTDSSVILEPQPSTSNNWERCIKKCPVCNTDSTLTCKNCLNVSYCCREHQKEHWKYHRPSCVLYEVAENESLGRHLVAKTNIKVGDLILKEFPLLLGPTGPDCILNHLKFDASQITDVPVDIGKRSKVDILRIRRELFTPICVGCYVGLGEDIVPAFCSECQWPLCDLQCLSYENHSLECKYFKEQKINFHEIMDKHLIPPRLYTVLKALLLSKEKPFVWDKLMNLQSHIEERSEIEQAYGPRLNDLYIAFLLKTDFKFTDIPLQVIDKIFGIIDTNAFYSAHSVPSTDTDKDKKSRKILCVYEKASMLSHACLPNAIAVRLYPPSLEVIAAVQIKKGDIIFINYDYQEPLRPKYERRQFLGLHYFFNCTCRLCEDPTEGGLFLSGVACLRCRRRGFEGYYAPENPFLMDPIWKCVKCGLVKTDGAIAKVIKDVSHQLYEGNDAIRRVVEKCSGQILHKNHYLMLHAEFDMIRLLYTHLSQSCKNLPVGDIIYLAEIMEKRIEILEKVLPPCHKSLVNLKIKFVDVLKNYAIKSTDDVTPSVSFKIQAVYDSVAVLLSKHSVKNSLHGYLLKCIREIRDKLWELHEYSRHQSLLRRLNAMKVDEGKVEDEVNPT